jgi:hypothetical protein
MKQFKKFLAEITELGIDYHTNWSIAQEGGDKLYFYVFKKDGNFTNVIVQVYAEDKGFEIYLESETSSIDDGALEIAERLKS